MTQQVSGSDGSVRLKVQRVTYVCPESSQIAIPILRNNPGLTKRKLFPKYVFKVEYPFQKHFFFFFLKDFVFK